MRKRFHFLICLAMLCACLLSCSTAQAASAPSYLTCAIVATDDLALRPLELNRRDVVSVLDLVYEGLFTMDDNYNPQPELAYSYEFISDGRRLRVVLRDDVTFHNGKACTIPHSIPFNPGRPKTSARSSSIFAVPATALSMRSPSRSCLLKK